MAQKIYKTKQNKLLEWLVAVFVVCFILRFIGKIPIDIIYHHVSNFAITGCLFVVLILACGIVIAALKRDTHIIKVVFTNPLDVVPFYAVVVIALLMLFLNGAIEIAEINSFPAGVGTFNFDNTPDVIDFISGILAIIPIVLLSYSAQKTVSKQE